MSEQLRESLSAAMDGEADAFELRRVLDEAKLNDDLREQWHRFHLMRDLLREDVKNYDPGLRESIWEELNQPYDDEDTVAELVLAEESVGEHRKRVPWVGRLTGTAVAAAVAVVVMINGGVFEDQATPVEFADRQPLVPGAELVPVMYSTATPQDMQRHNGLILRHIQHKAINQTGGASFVKLATFRGVPPPAPAIQTDTEQSAQEAAGPR